MLLTLLGPWWSKLTLLSLSELLYRMGLWTPSYRVVVGMEGRNEPLMGAQRMLLSAPDFSVTECFPLPDGASQKPPRVSRMGMGVPLASCKAQSLAASQPMMEPEPPLGTQQSLVAAVCLTER